MFSTVYYISSCSYGTQSGGGVLGGAARGGLVHGGGARAFGAAFDTGGADGLGQRVCSGWEKGERRMRRSGNERGWGVRDASKE